MGSRARTVKIAEITINNSIQPRKQGTNSGIVASYAEAMSEGATFPPIVVYQRYADGEFWLSEGFHRVAAAKASGAETIKAEVRKGGEREAYLNACSATNSMHGFRESNADKRLRVERLIEQFPKAADSKIARMAGVSIRYVGMVRPSCTVQLAKRGGKDSGSGCDVVDLPIEPSEDPADAPVGKKLSGRDVLKKVEEFIFDQSAYRDPPQKVAEAGGFKVDDVDHVQDVLVNKCRKGDKGRTVWVRHYSSKPSPPSKPAPRFSATDTFVDIMLSIVRFKQHFAEDFGGDFGATLSSDGWNDDYNTTALNHISECQKLLAELEKEIKSHVKKVALKANGRHRAAVR